MKIRTILLLTFITLTLSFGLIGYLEHRHIGRVATSFEDLDQQVRPSLIALLELTAATRRATLKAFESAIRGNPSDRAKTREALAQIEQHTQDFLALRQTPGETAELLVFRKDHYVKLVEEYLALSQGPSVDWIIEEQQLLHQARQQLLDTIDRLPDTTADELRYELLLIKSEAREAAIKLIEFTRHGRAADLAQTRDALQRLQLALQDFAGHPAGALRMSRLLADQGERYLQLTQQFLDRIADGHYALENVYAHEALLHAARKSLIHTLYPLVEQQYQALSAIGETTSTQLHRARRLQLYSVIAVAIVSLVAALLLANMIANPLRRLSAALDHFGRGEEISAHDLTVGGGSTEVQLLGDSVAAMIDERKKLEQAIQSSERFAHALLDSAPVGLALFRMDGTLVDANPAFAALIGRAVEETKGLSYQQLNASDYPESQQRTSLQQKGHFGPIRSEYRHKDGHSIPVRISTRLIERDGEPLIWSTVEDISALLEMEALHNRLQHILEHSFDEIYLFDDETLGFIQVSSGALHNLGYSLAEMQQMTPVDLKPDYTRQDFSKLLDRLRRGEQQRLVFETRHQRKDGSCYPVEVRLQYSAHEERPIFFAFILDISERKQAIEAIRKNQERYSLAARIGRSGAWEMWPAQGKLFFDENLTRLLGYEGHELSENLADWVDTVPEHARAEVAAALQSVVDGEAGEYSIEHPVLRKDGSIGWVYVQGAVVSQPGEQPLRIVGSSVDISERRRAEQALQLTQFSLDKAPDGVFWMQQDGSVNYVNEEACRSLGYTRQELLGMHVWEFDPDFPAEQWPKHWQSIRKLGRISLETRHQAKDGSIHPVEISAVYTKYGDLEHHSAFVRDISERKQAEQQLKQLNEELEQRVEQRTAMLKHQAQIIDQTHDSIVTTDLEGTIESWNQGAERLFGVAAQDAVGRHISFVYPQREHAFLAESVIQPLQEKGQHEVEVTMCRADGTEFPGHLSLSMLFDDSGAPRGMVGYTIDISDIKKREQALDQLTAQLQASNRELESFSYSVSHDLRAPLRAIDGFSLALVEDYSDQLDGIALDYLQRVRNGAQRMGTLIDDLLQLSRVSRGELKFEPVDLGAIATAVIQELRAGEPQRQVSLTLGPDLRAMGDPRLLRVMIDNLLGNAWKFTGKNENPEIVFDRQNAGDKAFFIRDNGVGFDMRHTDKLFGAFQRLHSSKEFPGTGVGLATVQRIVHRHGGKIWAQGHPGEGATFFFSLPTTPRAGSAT